MNVKMTWHWLPAMALVVVLTACEDSGSGGGGSGANSGGDETQSGPGKDDSGIRNGALIDSAVQGVEFETVTQSGVTDEEGTFEYKEGEVVEFRLGEMVLGFSKGKETVTPLDLVGGFSTTDERVVNVAQLLQTLDIDGDPSNGIALPPSVDLAKDTNIGDETSIQDAVTDYDSTITSLVTESEAQNHLISTLEEVPKPEFSSDYAQLYSSHNTSATVSCSDAEVSGMKASRNADGDLVIDAQITINGQQETLSGQVGDLWKISFGSEQVLYTDISSTPVAIEANDKKAILWWGSTSWGGYRVRDEPNGCWGTVMLSAEDGVNVEPSAFFQPGLEEICAQGQAEHGYSLSFAARDSDGYVPGSGTLEVKGAVEVSNGETTREGGAISIPGTYDYTGVTALNQFSGFGQYGGGVRDKFHITKPCDKKVTWKYTVTDNEGASYSVTGEIDSQDSGGGSSTGQYGSATLNGTSYGVEDASYDADGWIDGKFTTQKYGVMYVLVYQGSGDALLQDYSDPGTYQLASQYDENSEVNHEGPRVTVNSEDESALWAVVDGSVTVTGKGDENLVEISGTLVNFVTDGTGTTPRASQGTFEATMTVPK